MQTTKWFCVAVVSAVVLLMSVPAPIGERVGVQSADFHLMPKSNSTPRAATHAPPSLSDMIGLCSSRQWLKGEPIYAQPYVKYRVSPTLTCAVGSRFYHYAAQKQSFPSMNDSAVLEPLTSDRQLRFLLSRGGGKEGTSAEIPLRFHPSAGLWLVGTWNSVNWYHLLMDYLIGLAYVDVSLPTGELASLPREVLHVVNSSWNRRWGKSDQRSCVEFSSAFATAPFHGASSSVVSAEVDGVMHCYCAAVFVGEHTLPRGEPHAKFASETREAAMLEYKRRMSIKYAEELPFGVTPAPEHFTRLGYWTAGNLSAPRMLFVDRRRRRIGGAAELQQLAREVGFNVAAVHFEALSPSEQFHLSRYADVLVGIHGMALTYVANMDGTGRFGGDVTRGRPPCKTLIELMHWVNPRRFWYYEEMAPLNRVELHRVLPIDVEFGPSVVNKARERRVLLKNTFWWGLKGFDDQIAFFDTKTVQNAFEKAMKNWRECQA